MITKYLIAYTLQLEGLGRAGHDMRQFVLEPEILENIFFHRCLSPTLKYR